MLNEKAWIEAALNGDVDAFKQKAAIDVDIIGPYSYRPTNNDVVIAPDNLFSLRIY